MKRTLLAAPLLALATPAAAAPRIDVEAAAAVVLRDDPQGSLYDAEDAYGARATVDVPGLLPDPLRLDVGLLWYASGFTQGTRAVQVGTTRHTFALPIRAGWELGWRPVGDLRLVPYVSAGAAATLTSIDYLVRDPVGAELGARPQRTSASGWEPGAVYGAGLGFAVPGSDLGFVGRLEALRLHRGVHEDLTLALGLGLSF
jgi:opacity protein-like surface antigen